MQKAAVAFLQVLGLPSIFGSGSARAGWRRGGRSAFHLAARSALGRRAGHSRIFAAQSPWRLRLAYALVAVNIALVLASIVSVNDYAAGGYVLSELQTNIDKLSEQNKKLMVKSTELGSVVELQENLAASGYVAAGTPQFVQAGQLTQR